MLNYNLDELFVLMFLSVRYQLESAMPKIPSSKTNRISDAVVKTLKPIGGKQTEYAHPFERGFGVMVSSTGNHMQYFVRGMLNGKQVFRSLGPITEFKSIEDAQLISRKWRKQMKAGLDPKEEQQRLLSEQRKQEEETKARGITLKQALVRFLRDKRRAGKVRRSTLRNYSDDIQRYMGGKRFLSRGTCVVEWMDTPLCNISRLMVDEMRLAVRDGARRRGYGGEFASDKAVVSLSVIINHLKKVDDEFDIPNPTKNIEPLIDRPSERARGRYIREHEMAAWFDAVASDESSEVQRELILLILFTGIRREEACGLSWDEVDLANGTINLPAHRVKNGRAFSLPLSRYIWDRLIAWRSVHPNTHYVFPSPRSRSGHVAEPRAILDRISKYSEMKDSSQPVVNVSVHDLRRTFAKWGSREIAGISASPLWAVSLLCNHKIGGVTQESYAQLDALDFRKETEKTSQKILKAAGINLGDINVVPLRGVNIQ